jgi:hypothetical protein
MGVSAREFRGSSLSGITDGVENWEEEEQTQIPFGNDSQ